MRAKARVAAFVLHMALIGSNDNEIELPMSREDIADYLALKIETVSRVLSQLQNDTVIDLPSSRRILLRDRMALTRLTFKNHAAPIDRQGAFDTDQRWLRPTSATWRQAFN
jgi:Crp-like helix-turn-helix domain